MRCGFCLPWNRLRLPSPNTPSGSYAISSCRQSCTFQQEQKYESFSITRIVLDNQDDTADEFDSHSLNREKHLAAKSQATIFIGPLAPGRYIYEGESEVAGGPALGVIVVE